MEALPMTGMIWRAVVSVAARFVRDLAYKIHGQLGALPLGGGGFSSRHGRSQLGLTNRDLQDFPAVIPYLFGDLFSRFTKAVAQRIVALSPVLVEGHASPFRAEGEVVS